MPADFFPQPGRSGARSLADQDMSDRAILAHDLDGRIIDANCRFLRLTGFSRKDLIGQPISVLQEVDGGQARSQALTLLQRDQVARADLTFRGLAGTCCNLTALFLPLTSKRGLSGVIIIGRDSGVLGKGMPPPAALDQAA